MIPFHASGAFRPVAARAELRRLAVRGAAVTVSAQALALAAKVVSTVILAWLLTSADFDVVTMLTTFSLLLASFGLNGFTEATIQFEEMDHYTASNLFWLNSGAGLQSLQLPRLLVDVRTDTRVLLPIPAILP